MSKDSLPTFCGQYKEGVLVEFEEYNGKYCKRVNVRPVGRRYNNDLTYFYCGDCKNYASDSDDCICWNGDINESTDGKIYCMNYEVENG